MILTDMIPVANIYRQADLNTLKVSPSLPVSSYVNSMQVDFVTCSNRRLTGKNHKMHNDIILTIEAIQTDSRIFDIEVYLNCKCNKELSLLQPHPSYII